MIGREKQKNMSFFLLEKCRDLTSERFGNLNLTFESEMKNVLFIELFSDDRPRGFDGMFAIFV